MKSLALILLSFIVLPCVAQRKPNTLHLGGTVLGYNYNPAGLFKKEKVAIQGSLKDVKLNITDINGDNVTTKKTDDGGEFELRLELNAVYTVSYSKSGYGNSAFELDLRNIPKDMASAGLTLENFELILNDNETDKAVDNGKPFAHVYYDNNSRKFKSDYYEFKGKEKLFKKVENSTPINLLKNSLSKNAEANQTPTSNTVSLNESTKEIAPSSIEKGSNPVRAEKSQITVLSDKEFKEVDSWSDLTKADLEQRAKEITEAWNQLEKDKLIAVTQEDFLVIQAREQMLIAAEEQLAAARIFLDEQEEKIAAQNNLIYAFGGALLLLGAFVFVLIRSIKEKKKTNAELAIKNKRIMSSITYAERIQRSVLLSDDQIKSLFPESFVFYQPLDVVSGDFYWFSKVGNKTVMAAIDCTGHGVPGAFMSLIANTLMNQIVNEKQITAPAQILTALHEGIVESLKQEESEDAAQDGMDLSVCTWDASAKTLTYSGAMNPIYLVHAGDITELSGNLRGVGGILRRKRPEAVKFKEQEVKVEAGTCVYLFSDGYMDQFGGAVDEKFNVSRFKALLMEMHTLPMDQQKDKAKTTLEDWKGNSKQIDDILLIGVRV